MRVVGVSAVVLGVGGSFVGVGGVGHSLKKLSSNDQLFAGAATAGVAAAVGAGAVELVGAAALLAAELLGGAVWLATQASKSGWLTTFTSIGMKLWSVPQSCEHWP